MQLRLKTCCFNVKWNFVSLKTFHSAVQIKETLLDLNSGNVELNLQPVKQAGVMKMWGFFNVKCYNTTGMCIWCGKQPCEAMHNVHDLMFVVVFDNQPFFNHYY